MPLKKLTAQGGIVLPGADSTPGGGSVDNVIEALLDEFAPTTEVEEARRDLLTRLIASRAGVERMVEPMEGARRLRRAISIAEDSFPPRPPDWDDGYRDK